MRLLISLLYAVIYNREHRMSSKRRRVSRGTLTNEGALIMTPETTQTLLHSLSSELAALVERIAPSVVRVDDGARLTASGTLWSADGIVVTTSHGVERDEELAIELADGSRHVATLIGRDHDTDLAVLKVDATGLPAIEQAGPADARAGQFALALGRPGVHGLEVTLGLLNARVESQSGGNPEYLLHTDATFYPGFSGGPLVDMSGKLIGLCNLNYGRGRNVALGTPTVAHVVEAIVARGRVQRGYLGVRTQAVTLPESVRTRIALKQAHALMLVGIEEGGPADRGSLMLGDTLLGLDDRTVADVNDLRRYLRAQPAGRQVQVHLLRGGELVHISVTLGAEPTE
jgi:S1-C subfamily serine protease